MSQLDHSIIGRQIAAGRALVGLSQPELARGANISVPTLKRMEASEGAASGLPNNLLAVRHALEAMGIEFTNGGQPGVRLRALKAGEIVRCAPTGKTGAVIDRVPNMGGMVWVEFSDGPMSVERGKLTIMLAG